jgi:5-methylcytosine-specific restriction endonuclease McrA
MKLDRNMIRGKYGGRCAYCGKVLDNKFHVDHIKSKRSGGTDEPDNLNPACPSCNAWKRVYSIEEFRKEIELQRIRLMNNSAVKLALRYEILKWTDNKVVFYFEDYENDNQIKKLVDREV